MSAIPRRKEETSGLLALEQQAQAIDLEKIAQRLGEPVERGGKGWDPAKIEDSVSLYREFLVLCALYPDEPLVPTKAIDEVWHQHILDTRQYPIDCQRLLGQFLHHSPDYEPLQNRTIKDVRFERTRRLFRDTFGHDISTEHALCGKCYCDN